MSSFTDELTVTHMDISGGALWRIEREFFYEVGDKGTGRVIRVPVKFMTDGASVPRILWNFFPAWGTYSRAAVIHDYLCYRLHDARPHPEAPTRRDADRIFKEAMVVCGTGWFVRNVLYLGVRIGDWSNRLPYQMKNIVSSSNDKDL